MKENGDKRCNVLVTESLEVSFCYSDETAVILFEPDEDVGIESDKVQAVASLIRTTPNDVSKVIKRMRKMQHEKNESRKMGDGDEINNTKRVSRSTL